MALTRDFKQTVQARAGRDPAFRQALLQGAVAAPEPDAEGSSK